MAARFTRGMTSHDDRPDPRRWAHKLHQAAAELRAKSGGTPMSLAIARRLERYAEAILFPQLPGWWADRAPEHSAAAGDD